jgi:hypothetical protein
LEKHYAIFLKYSKGAAMTNISLDQIINALSQAGDPWEAGVTSLSELPLEA